MRRADHAGIREKRVKELGLAGGKVRINKAGCLDRCEEGVMVVYPEGTWYTYVTDIDEIVESHLRDGKVVDRLKI